MKNRTFIFSLLFIALVIVSLICTALWRTRARLQTENQALRAEVNELTAAARIPAPAPDQALAAEFEKQKTELLRLRNEVAQFRANRDAKRAEEELARARGNQSQAAASKVVVPAEGQSIPSSDWRFMGYETPEATLISGLWAMKEGQLVGLMDTFTPEERKRFEAQMQEKSEGEMLQRLQKEFAQVNGLRVVGQHELPSGEVVLDVYLEGIGKLKKYQMSQVNNEWKAGGPVNQNFNPLEPQTAGNSMMYYMSNPELMKRYFPQMYEMMKKGQPQQGQPGANGQAQPE
jgi:hypothetical protein